MSKLQLLAQRRKLEKLGQQQQQQPDQDRDQPKPPALSAMASPSTGLSKLLQKRKLDVSNPSSAPSSTSSQGNSGAMASLLARKKALASQQMRTQVQTQVQTQKQTPSPSSQLSPTQAQNIPAHSINLSKFAIGITTKPFTHIQRAATHILPQIIFSNHTQQQDHYHDHDINTDQEPKRRKVDAFTKELASDLDTNIPSDIADKITKNFKTQSPDDKRKVVESLSEKVSNVDISEQSTTSSISSTGTTQRKKLTVTKPKNKIDVEMEISKKTIKPLLSVIVIGHVDSGKSTTIGRLLYDLGIVDSRTLNKLTRDAELAGKGSFSLAWVMDQTPEERSRGVTIDIVQTQFETDTCKFAIIDSPGHKDYLPQMINGISQADVAVVILDSTSDLIFEANTNASTQNKISSERTLQEIAKGQTFEQLTIARNMGIEKVVLVVNKMDVSDWDQSRFDSISHLMNDYLVNELDFKATELHFVPASGFNGDNIVKKGNCDWYKGPTLFEYLEKLNMDVNKNVKDTLAKDAKNPFVLTVTDITYGSGIDSGNGSSLVSTGGKKSDTITVHGRVNNGLLQPGESVQFWPSLESGQVDTITTTVSQINGGSGNGNDKIIEKLAVPGEFVELKVRKVNLPEAIAIGDLITKVDNNKNDNELVKCSDKFVCELRMFGLSRPVLVGTPFVLFKGNVSYSAKLAGIEWVETKNTDADGNIILKKSKKRKHLSSGQRAKVIIESDKFIPVTESVNKLNRIVLRKEGLTVGAGKIKSAIIE